MKSRISAVKSLDVQKFGDQVALPLSVLRFVRMTNLRISMTAYQKWHWTILAPFSSARILEMEMSDWNEQMELVSAHWHYFYEVVDVILACIGSAVRNRELLDHLDRVSNLLFVWIDVFKGKQRLALFAICMMFCRLHVKFQQESASKFIDSAMEESAYEDVVLYCMWILSPTKVFPLEGSACLDIETAFPEPCYEFSRTIAPKIVAKLLTIGGKNHADSSAFSMCVTSLMCAFGDDPETRCSLFSGMTDEFFEALLPLLDRKSIFEFIVLLLQISCNYQVFSNVYQRISNDLEKTLAFVRDVAEKSSLATEFLSIDSTDCVVRKFVEDSTSAFKTAA